MKKDKLLTVKITDGDRTRYMNAAQKLGKPLSEIIIAALERMARRVEAKRNR